MIVERRFFSNFQWSILVLMLMLCGVGLLILYSAGYNVETNSSPAMKRQAFGMAIGLVAFIFASLISPNVWKRWSYVLYIAVLLLLIAVKFAGSSAGGAQRWVELGPVRVQPSEFMKLGIILAMARFLSSDKTPTEGFTLKTLCLPATLLLVPVLITLTQPDLGTAICQMAVGGSMLFLAGIRWKTCAILGSFLTFAAAPAWHLAKDYQKKRILNFLTPELDPLGSGYHAIQSKIAVGSGAIIGKGLLKGTQTQLRFLPEQTTDFIFSVFSEEWGFIGTSTVIILYGLLIYKLYQVCARCEERFGAFVCFGTLSLFFWQVFINIGMVTGSLPVVGITLPLLSFGGSSVLTLMTSLGIVAGIGARRFKF